MKVLKKATVAAVAAASVLTFGLAGCGSSSSTSSDGRITIVAWHGFSEADGKALTKIAAQFNASQKKYTIKTELQPWTTIGEQLVTKVSTGNGPDIVTTGADNGEGWVLDGTFQCVQDFYNTKSNETDKYRPTVTAQTKYLVKGKRQQCAVPMAYAPTVVWYNTKMWQAAGLTSNDYPKTWDQLLEVSKKLTIKGKQYGLALSDSGWSAFIKGNGTGVYNAAGKVTVDSPKNIAFLEKMRNFYADGYSKKGMDDTAARASFESGQSAMVIVGPWEDEAATAKGISHDLFPVPDGDGTYKYPDGTTGSNTGAAALYWWMTAQVKDNAKKKGIYEFFKYWNNHKNQIAWSLGSAYPPNRTDVTADELSKRPLIAKLSQYTSKAFIGFTGLKGGFGDINSEMDSISQDTARTNKPVSTILSAADKKITGYLNQYSTQN